MATNQEERHQSYLGVGYRDITSFVPLSLGDIAIENALQTVDAGDGKMTRSTSIPAKWTRIPTSTTIKYLMHYRTETSSIRALPPTMDIPWPIHPF